MPMPQYNGPMYSQGPTAVGPYNMQGYQPTFGYNPQQTYMPQTPQPSPSQEPMAIPHLIGRSISANDQIPPKEIPSDGSPAYFPMQDGSAILVKVWTGNGTIQTVRYVPEQVQQPSQPEEHSNEEILKRLESLESKITLHDELVAYRMEDKDNTIAELRSQVNALNLSASQSNQNAYLVAQLKTPAPVPAYTVPNPNGYYGCQQNCYQSCGC